jgi:hypothetical protein
MQEISPIRYACTSEIKDAFIATVRGIARRLSFFVRSPFDKLKANGLLNIAGLLGRMNNTLFLSPTASLESRHEVALMYFGRASDALMMTSERVVIPTGRYTLGHLLCSLYKRGERWVEELDDSHLLCTVNGRDAWLFDRVKPGDEICISSKKSVFES